MNVRNKCVSKEIGKSDFIEMFYQLVKKLSIEIGEKIHTAKVEKDFWKDEETIISQKLKVYAEDPEVTYRRVGMTSCYLAKDRR